MNAASLLLTPERRLRAPWRIVLFLIVLFGALILSTAIEGIVDAIVASRGYEPLVSDWGVPIGLMLATAVMLKWVEGKGWQYVGLGRTAAEPKILATGTAYGLAAIAVPSLFLLLIGELRWEPSTPGSSIAAAGISFANLLPAAFGEELLLRGYIFAVLLEAVGWRLTLISTSIVFGLLHVANPGADAQSIAIVMLAGFFLGSVFLATRSLWATTLAHFIWNWFMAAGLHTPVSGIEVSTPDYRVVDAGPDWLTGGAWGPEGGVAAAVGMFGVMIYLHARQLRRMES